MRWVLAILLFAGCGSIEDKDGDGYTADVDCCDVDVRAFPGQTLYFTTPINNTSSYDFDCNGFDETEMPDMAGCWDDKIALCESRPSGWYAAVPACGEIGEWVLTCGTGLHCYPNPQKQIKTQACR